MLRVDRLPRSRCRFSKGRAQIPVQMWHGRAESRCRCGSGADRMPHDCALPCALPVARGALHECTLHATATPSAYMPTAIGRPIPRSCLETVQCAAQRAPEWRRANLTARPWKPYPRRCTRTSGASRRTDTRVGSGPRGGATKRAGRAVRFCATCPVVR